MGSNELTAHEGLKLVPNLKQFGDLMFLILQASLGI